MFFDANCHDKQLDPSRHVPHSGHRKRWRDIAKHFFQPDGIRSSGYSGDTDDQSERWQFHRLGFSDAANDDFRGIDLLYDRRYDADAIVNALQRRHDAHKQRHGESGGIHDRVQPKRRGKCVLHDNPTHRGDTDDQSERWQLHRLGFGDDGDDDFRGVDLLHDGRYDTDTIVNALQRRHDTHKQRYGESGGIHDWVQSQRGGQRVV